MDSHLPSPAKLLNRQRFQTTIPSKIRESQPDSDNIREWLDAKSTMRKAYHDQHSKKLAPLFEGQPIAWFDHSKNQWFPGKVLKKLDHDSYLIKTQMGGIYRRTRKDIRERHLPFTPRSEGEKQSEVSLRPHYMKDFGRQNVQTTPPV